MADQHTNPSRRSVISAGAAVIAGAGALSACSSDNAATGAGSASAGAASAAGGAAAAAVTPLSEIPVGGAVVKKIADQDVVLAQPEAGSVVAHSAKCTHQGCLVAVAGTELKCPCHGSVFNAETGAVENGPATQPLPSLKVSVSSAGVTLT